jgi:hypothetical protein
MRAKEFITEDKHGDLPGTFAQALPNAGYTADKYYDMYRLSMLVGRMPEAADDIDFYSWIGQTPYIGAYSKEEYEIIKKAAKKAGIPFGTHVASDSAEHEAVNTKSIAKPFKGYKGTNRKK